jgi:hypothetical protein
MRARRWLAPLGRAPIDAIPPITGGASTASTFRVDAGGRCYLLRLEGEPSPLRNPHQYVSMRIAAEAGIAPKIRYVDEAARVAVIDFIAQQPLKIYPGGLSALAHAWGELLSRVQATPVFPAFVDYPVIVARLFAPVRRTGLWPEKELHAGNNVRPRPGCAWSAARRASAGRRGPPAATAIGRFPVDQPEASVIVCGEGREPFCQKSSVKVANERPISFQPRERIGGSAPVCSRRF